VTGTATVGCVHEAFFYDSDEDLLTGTVPFLRDGLAADELVVLTCSERKNRLLTGALGDDPRLRVLHQQEVYRRPTEAIAAYRRVLDREGITPGSTRRTRVFGEIPYDGGPEAWAEWGRYESVLNKAFESFPVAVVCGHDTRGLPAEVLATSELTHPGLTTTTCRESSDRYLDPAEYLRRTMTTQPDPIEDTVPVLVVPEVEDLRSLRDALRSTLETCEARVAQDLSVAVNEVVANAVRHGGSPVSVRLWSAADRVVCTVTDHGNGFDDPFAGYLAAVGPDPMVGEVGLWLVRQLCDQIDFRPDRDSFTVRLTVRH
jgi:anti-sigma regulatory factor (Ser/Thr protein kinase)